MAHNERLSPFLGLPVFSSDALSSVAYATEAILGILVLGSNFNTANGPLRDLIPYQIWISVAIVVLIGIVALSYNQTIHAYPSGGGSYIVASENLGETAGLLAGAALLVDYVLTVSVSVAAGVVAITSAFPSLAPHVVPLSLLCIAVVAWANLRGVKESGAVFAIPTYGFIVGMAILIIVGIFKSLGQTEVHQTIVAMKGSESLIGKELSFALVFVVLRAFAAGCTALTGIEAVSNGVQAFKPPESHNASVTLRWMAAILAFMFLGTSYLAMHLPTLNLDDSNESGYMTVVAQIAAWAFGFKQGGHNAVFSNIGFYYIQFMTAAILVLAANTSFADFPRLSSLLARDGYLPRPLSRQGDRLVFHNGILLLALAAGFIIWKFDGKLDSLLPLYAVGVFTAFTLSQFGMVQHWRRERGSHWIQSAIINGFGAGLTLVVTAVIFWTKFRDGAWIVAILLAILFALFKAISGRYASISKQLALEGALEEGAKEHMSLLLVPRVHKGIAAALAYAKLLDLDCRAVHVAINKKALPEVMAMWERYGQGVPLEVLNSPYRSLVQPVLDLVDEELKAHPDRVITVIVPEAVASTWVHRLLQENVANQLKTALGSRENVVVTNVRYFLD